MKQKEGRDKDKNKSKQEMKIPDERGKWWISKGLIALTKWFFIEKNFYKNNYIFSYQIIR